MIQENFKDTDDSVQENSSAQLQRQITATRARMSETLDELSDEIKPRRFIEQYVNEYSEQLVETVTAKSKHYAKEVAQQTKRNPLPLLALVAGVAFFISQTGRKNDPSASDADKR